MGTLCIYERVDIRVITRTTCHCTRSVPYTLRAMRYVRATYQRYVLRTVYYTHAYSVCAITSTKFTRLRNFCCYATLRELSLSLSLSPDRSIVPSSEDRGRIEEPVRHQRRHRIARIDALSCSMKRLIDRYLPSRATILIIAIELSATGGTVTHHDQLAYARASCTRFSHLCPSRHFSVEIISVLLLSLVTRSTWIHPDSIRSPTRRCVVTLANNPIRAERRPRHLR